MDFIVASLMVAVMPTRASSPLSRESPGSRARRISSSNGWITAPKRCGFLKTLPPISHDPFGPGAQDGRSPTSNAMTDDLTPRQEQVARYVAIGFSDKRIAEALEIDEETVAFHIARIAKRWNLDTQRNTRVQITQRFLGSVA